MTPLTEIILDSGNADRVLSVQQLERLLGGSSARRYGLVNRALKAGELLKARRGLYVLAEKYRQHPLHEFVLAQQWVPGSYVSAETALSFHNWIPEGVHSVVSMTLGGKSMEFTHEVFGKFEFCRMTVKQGYFLQAVARHELQNQIALIAEPVRALLDMVYLRKLKWQGLDYLLEGLRIDEQALKAVPSLSITMLLDVYKGKREQLFIEELLRELGL
ncbi:MAG: hypothetical protein OEW89_02365 [Gammaproteobacteria bacterium]|nr:hypothetical protein [Gammaproteobacteria bacterium]